MPEPRRIRTCTIRVDGTPRAARARGAIRPSPVAAPPLVGSLPADAPSAFFLTFIGFAIAVNKRQ
jgi:hypothetical protein